MEYGNGAVENGSGSSHSAGAVEHDENVQGSADSGSR